MVQRVPRVLVLPRRSARLRQARMQRSRRQQRHVHTVAPVPEEPVRVQMLPARVDLRVDGMRQFGAAL